MRKKSNDELERYLDGILQVCKENGRILSRRELSQYGYSKDTRSLKSHLNFMGYANINDYLRDFGLYKSGDVEIDGIYKDVEDVTYEELIYLFKEFHKRYGRYPSYNDMQSRIKNQYNLLSYSQFDKLIKNRGLDMDEFRRINGFKKSPTKVSKFNINKYNDYLKMFLNISNNLGRAIPYNKISNYNLPNPKWLIDNHPNKNVKTYNDFVRFLGLTPNYGIRKEEIIDVVMDIYQQNGSVHMTDVLNHSSSVNMRAINSIWGNFNNMLDDLGIPINQENMLKKKSSLDEVKEDVNRVCHYILSKEGRRVISFSDISRYGKWKISTYAKYFRENNETLASYIDSIGFQSVEPGHGRVHLFKDGERTLSTYEYSFSKFLRDNKFKYNHTYYRDVDYSDFITYYSGNMNCDYLIRTNDSDIYVEVAGFLRDYENNYHQDIPISNKSKESYRIKLKEKEHMLKGRNVNYLILFPSDFETGAFKDILLKSRNILIA